MIAATIVSPIFGFVISGCYFLYHANWNYIIIPEHIKVKIAKADYFSLEHSFIYYKDEMVQYWIKKSIETLPTTIFISLIIIFIVLILKDIKTKITNRVISND
jgi:hypothetical protein